MARYRDVFLEKDKTLADSGSVTIELAVVDPISEIHIRVKNKNGATSNKNNPISRNISKIEIVDGSNVIYSLRGELAQAMSYYQRGVVPSMQRQGGPSENQEDLYVIRFGRWLWDPFYALVPQNFRNLQLKVTWNFATVTAVGATGYLADNGKLSITARLMEGLEAPPIGFMMAKDHFAWTTAASGDERISLPTDFPYVMALFRAWETETKLYSTITNIKLSIDQDKVIPIDSPAWDLLKQMENDYGQITLEQHVFAASEENIQTWLGVGESVVVTPEGQDAVGATAGAIPTVYGVDSGHFNLKLYGNDGQVKAASILQMVARGQALNHCFAIPFGTMDDPASWLNAPAHGDIKAIITQGNVGAAANFALLQARPYAVAA